MIPMQTSSVRLTGKVSFEFERIISYGMPCDLK